MNSKTCSLPLLFLPLLLSLGCKTMDFARVRRAESEGLLEEMSSRTAESLPRGEPVSLEQCIEIALFNNWNVKTSEIRSRLAELDRKAAFSAFLPVVDAELTSYTLSDPPTVDFLGMSIQMGDKDITEMAVHAQMPVFAPQAWFAYAARKKAEDIGAFVLRRTRQLICLRVIALYHSCLTLEKMRGVFSQSLEQAETLLQEAEALAGKGLATPAEVEAAKTLVVSRQLDLSGNERALSSAKGELLLTMGLSPQAEITLQDPPPFETPQGEVEDWILSALLNRPELAAADRNVEIQKDQIKIAIADFVPGLGVGGAWTNSSDSFVKYSTVWTAGIKGVLTLFDGFANVAAYKAAKERHQEAFLRREEQCVTIMLEVLRAKWNLDSATEALALARQYAHSESLRFREIQAQYREGLVQTSSFLDAMSRKDRAFIQVTVAEFQSRVAAATLWDVMGKARKEQ